MRLRSLVFVAVLLAPASPVFASSYSQLVVFGDSLSDNGNAHIADGNFPGPNYGQYTFSGTPVTTSFYSDGPNTTPTAAGPQGLWVDQIAPRLGVADPLPFLASASGTNYAVASAETGTANPQDIGNQVAAFVGGHTSGAPGSALYAFWGGANDILDGKSPTAAADNIENYIQGLSAVGAKNFVWLNLPLLGDTPDGQVAKAALNAASLAFNGEWARDLQSLQGAGIDVTGVNIGNLFTSIVDNPSQYGLTNVTTPAQGLSLTTDAGYLFWDGKHPTTQGHALVADTVYDALNPTPEPAAIGFALFGLTALAGLGIRNRRSGLRQ